MKQRFLKMFSWFAPAPTAPMPPPGVRIHMPRSVMHALRKATKPNALHHEPLAFLMVRYASEEVRDVLVAIGVMPFPEEAYVEGDAVANFDTRWCVDVANDAMNRNVGLVLAHTHGGFGRPAFSSTDRETNTQVMARLSIGVDVVPYGAVVLSSDDVTAVVSVKGRLVEARITLVVDRLGGLDLSA